MAWKLLFGSDIGLFSLFTILVVIGIGVAMFLFFRRKMQEDEQGDSSD